MIGPGALHWKPANEPNPQPMEKTKATCRSLLVLIGIVIVTFCAPLLGVFSPPGDWYASLSKPTWNPPGWIFGPVWTVLYLMMAVAAWWVWKSECPRQALVLYGLQLLLNAAWTPTFFGAQQIGLAFAVIIALWLAIVLTVVSFFRVSGLAGWLLMPYLAWVTFAAFLNFTLWRMNPL